MRFITEGDLRVQYRQNPFLTFELASNERLTPEARQFLLDKKIALNEENLKKTELPEKKIPQRELSGLIEFYFDTLALTLLEVAQLAVKFNLGISQDLFLLETVVQEIKNQADSVDLTAEKAPEELEIPLTPVYVLSEQGALLIKIRSAQTLIKLLQKNVTQRQHGQLSKVDAHLAGILYQLIGVKET